MLFFGLTRLRRGSGMNDILTLMRPRFLSFKNKKNAHPMRVLLFGILGAVLWAGLFAVSLRLLSYFQSIEALGDILAWKLLSMILVVYFSLLVFSSILTALSKLFLSKDLLLVHAMPVSSYKVFCARWLESTIDSTWTIFIFVLPVLISYGIIYNAGPSFYALAVIALLLLSLIASATSAALVMVAVVVIPPGRMKSVFVFLGLLLFLLLYLAFRMVRPERLVDPEAFETFLSYLKIMETPSSPFLPTTWVLDAFHASLTGAHATALLNLGLVLTCTGAMVSLSIILAGAVYAKGVSKSQTARKTWRSPRPPRSPGLLSFLPRKVQAYVIKEIKTFFRDQSQWSQIFLIAALIVIYVYNFKVLPLDRAPIETVYLQNILAFLNVGLASFVLTAVTGRFAYPAVSLEGEAFWIVAASPIQLKTFVWIKYFIYLVPLLMLTEVLIVATNILLQVSPFMMWLSMITVLFIVPAVVALGIGLGAAYPDFNSENAAQAVTSFGGLVFMMLASALIGTVIVLEAGPTYRIFMSGATGRAIPPANWVWIIGSFAVAALISILTLAYSMKYGVGNLTRVIRKRSSVR
jgi:ABC-2 type transport system permease protein